MNAGIYAELRRPGMCPNLGLNGVLLACLLAETRVNGVNVLHPSRLCNNVAGPKRGQAPVRRICCRKSTPGGPLADPLWLRDPDC